MKSGTKPRHLAKAPITEAIIDWRVKLPDNFNVLAFREVAPQLSDLPIIDEQVTVKATFDGFPMHSSSRISPPLPNGFAFSNSERSRIAQFRKDGFTYNCLPPYSSWEDVFGAAHRLWNVYADFARPIHVSRIAVRYINKINLPLPIIDLRQFVNSTLDLPEEWPKEMLSMLSRVVLKEQDIVANVTQLLEGPSPDGYLPLIFDIDVFRDKLFDVTELSGIGSHFEQLREMKNRIFFGNLQPKTVDLLS